MTKLTIEMERALEHRCPQLVDLLKNAEGRIEVERLLDVYEGERTLIQEADAEARQKKADELASIPAE